MNKCVTILNFSPRKSGNCGRISSHIKNNYKQTDVYTYSINADVFNPCGNCDYECLKPDEKCPQLSTSQKTIMDAICQSDLVYFIIPNYCGYPCASYFAFNERTVGYFDGDNTIMERYMSVPKRFIIVSNTQSEVFLDAARQQTDQKPDILYLMSGKYQKRSIAGDILDAVAAVAELDEYLSRSYI